MALSPALSAPTPWNRADIFPTHDGPEVYAALERLAQDRTAFAARQSELARTMDAALLTTLIQQFESIAEQTKTFEVYAELWLAENAADLDAQAFEAQVRLVAAESANRTLFLTTWWKALAEDDAARLQQAIPAYRHWLAQQRAAIPYTRSEAEEEILARTHQPGVATLRTLYQTLTGRYRFPIEIAGARQEITPAQLPAYVLGPDPDVRWAACEAVFRVYHQDRALIGPIYQAIARAWWTEQVDIRGFASPIAARNLKNDIPDAVVETLLAVCQHNRPLFHRYFRLKAHWLGVDPMRPSDIFAPIAAPRAYPLAEALDLIVAAFRAFDPALATMLEALVTAGHVDTESRPGSRRGAWCFPQTPRRLPWILVSYTDHMHNVIELGHECGHAIHAILAGQQTMLNYTISIPLAETAAIFAEMLLVDHMIATEPDPLVRQSLRVQQLDAAGRSIQRPIAFTRFEQQAYPLIQQGGTIDAVAALYLETLRAALGPDVDIPEIAQWEWLMLAVLYYDPFYAYSYAFGHLLALALYQRYTIEGPIFVPQILQILAAGGSDSPAAILARVGIDIADPAFWQAGFDRLGAMVDALATTPPFAHP